MYPVLFRIGSIEITSFGVLVAIAALVGLWLLRRELRRSGAPEGATDAAVFGIFAGLAGAKLLWVVEHLGDEPVSSLVLSRAGLSWFGGLAAGLGTALWIIWRRGWSAVSIVAAATPALAVGHAIGRIGCFLVGDDYGRPSNLPWAVAFPNGAPPTTVPVHPTQLYEAAALTPIVVLLLRMRRDGASDGRVIGSYLVLTGVVRFLIEFVRVNERVALGLTVAHWAALVSALAGVVFLLRSSRDRRRP
jgi:phosphatidylglycerol:prolipoprotein diacylglycerol transferase